MNQPTTNSSFVNNATAPIEVPSRVAPSKQGSALPGTASPKPLAKRAKRKPKSLAKTPPENRCRHYTSTGRRCRLAVLDPASGLCFRHVGLQFQVSDEDLSPAFAGLLSGFHSAAGLHAFLTQLTVLLVQNRISTRRAAVLSYLGQILLRTLPAIDRELDADNDREPQIIFDLPRPKRDWPEDPERAAYARFSAHSGPNDTNAPNAMNGEKGREGTG